MEERLECAKALLRGFIRRIADFCEEVLRGADEIMVLIGEAFDAKSCCECSFGECSKINMGRDILFARIFQGSRVAAMSTIAAERAVRSMRSEQFEAREPVVDDEDEAFVHAPRKSVNPVAGDGAKLGNCSRGTGG